MAHGTDEDGRMITFPRIECSVREEGVMNDHTFASSCIGVAPGIGFGLDTHFFITLYSPSKKRPIHLDYDEVPFLILWRAVRMCRELKRFRIGGRFSNATPDDLVEALGPSSEDEVLLRLQHDFSMDASTLIGFIQEWKDTTPNSEDLLSLLDCLLAGSHEQATLVSSLQDDVASGKINPTPELLRRLQAEEDLEYTDNPANEFDDPLGPIVGWG